MADDEIFNKEIESLHEILNKGEVEEVHKLRQSKIFLSLLTRYHVELITSISTFLNDKRLYKCPNIIKCYEEILRLIVEEVKPEDLFVTLLEQLDEENCCVEKFFTLLAPLKFSLIKLSSTRGYWLEWTLSTVKCYLESIHFPEDHEIEFDQKKMMVNDQHVDTILHLSEKLLEFYQTFVKDTITAREKDALIVFGFHILAEPLMYLYLEKFNKLRQICDQILLGIDQLYGKEYYLFGFVDETKAFDLEELECDLNSCLYEDYSEGTAHHLWDKIKILPLAVYFSVLIVDTPFTKYFPLVYHPMYLFHKLLYLSVLLMQHQHNAVVRKGLLLCHHILHSIPKGSIPYWYLEYRTHRKFVKAVSRVSIYSYILENRKSAIELLQTYLHKFDSKGSYLLLMNITSETNSEDIDGEIITFFRNMIHKRFLENNFHYYHKGKYLIDLLKVFSKLGENSDTDLIASKNKIVSLLYLFALILRRDVQNETTIRDNFDYFDRNYFSVVKKAVEKSREKYTRDAVTFINEDNVSIVVEGKSLPKLQRVEKLNAIKNTLNALDMIEHAMELVYEYI